MSVWRAQIDISFKLENDLVAFLNLIETFDSVMVSKKDGNLPILKEVTYHECFHDEGKACGRYVTVDFDNTEKFKNKNGVKVEPVDIIEPALKQKIISDHNIVIGDTGKTTTI